jgi:long-subunit fatty acid transport protein
MKKQQIANSHLSLSIWLFLLELLLPLPLWASFIESSMGAAVVNDATATYYNPAALTVLKSSQIISLNSYAYFSSTFKGQTLDSTTGIIQSGSSNSHVHYFLPAFYFGVPTTDKITFGFAMIFNAFNKDTEENSILRYDQPNNRIQSRDLVPAVGIKINEYLSIGAGINFTYANFLLRPITGFPSLNIPDSESRNETQANGLGGEAGFLLQPNKKTTIGFNFRNAITYKFKGRSVFENDPDIISNHYSFDFWTPARGVLSINYFLTSTLGLIGTVQRIQWSIFKDINIHGIATPLGIVDAEVPYHLRNTWLMTVGAHYHLNSKWIIRGAGIYNQSPGNPNTQISNGDNFILGASLAYKISKNFNVDAGYAHVFIQNENIHITRARHQINGVNSGFRDAVSLKLTVNL